MIFLPDKVKNKQISEVWISNKRVKLQGVVCMAMKWFMSITRLSSVISSNEQNVEHLPDSNLLIGYKVKTSARTQLGVNW